MGLRIPRQSDVQTQIQPRPLEDFNIPLPSPATSVGILDDVVASPGEGTGEVFRDARFGQAINTVGGAVSAPSPESGQFQDLINQALISQAGQTGAGARRDLFEQDFESGLNTALATARRQLGGTGLAGSLQGQGQFGDIVGSALQARSQGLGQLGLQNIQQLGALSQVGGQNLRSELLRKGFTFDQALNIAQLLQQQGIVAQQGIAQGNQQAIQAGAGGSFLEQLGGGLFSLGGSVLGGAGAAGGFGNLFDFGGGSSSGGGGGGGGFSVGQGLGF